MRGTRENMTRVRWAAIGAAVAVAIGGGAVGIVRATVSDGTRDVFVAITPCRLFDTRVDTNVGPRMTPLAQNETFTQPVTGANGQCSIPTDANAVALNVTVVNGTARSFLAVFPADVQRPLASSLNWVANSPPTPNKVDAKLSADGKLSFFNNAGSVDVLADVVGYYADHNHDDRYYTKAQVDALVGSGIQTINIDGTSATMFSGSVTEVNGCATGADPNSFYVFFPIPMPVGSRLLSVDVAVLDGFNATQRYVVTLVGGTHQTGPISWGSTNLAPVIDNPGAGTTIVRYHIEPTSPYVVGTDNTTWVQMFGVNMPTLGTSGNALCSVAATYDLTP